MREITWRRVNIAHFQIDKLRSNTDTAAGGPLSTPSPDAAIARHIRLAHELTMFAPIRRDIALCHGEWRDTLTIEPCTVTLSWGTPSVQDPPADPSWVGATVEEDQVIMRWKPNLEPFFYSCALYVTREANLPNYYPWFCCVRRCESIPPRHKGCPPTAFVPSAHLES